MRRDTWHSEMERLAVSLRAAEVSDFPDLARELHRALGTAPPEVTSALGAPCSRARLDSLLMSGSLREAAFELGGSLPYVMSRAGDGQVKVTLISALFPETHADGSHEAVTFAAALSSGLRDWARATSGSRLRR